MHVIEEFDHCCSYASACFNPVCCRLYYREAVFTDAFLCFSIKDDHASLINEGGSCKVVASVNSRVLVNGEPVSGEIALHHRDR